MAGYRMSNKGRISGVSLLKTHNTKITCTVSDGVYMYECWICEGGGWPALATRLAGRLNQRAASPRYIPTGVLQANRPPPLACPPPIPPLDMHLHWSNFTWTLSSSSIYFLITLPGQYYLAYMYWTFYLSFDNRIVDLGWQYTDPLEKYRIRTKP